MLIRWRDDSRSLRMFRLLFVVVVLALHMLGCAPPDARVELPRWTLIVEGREKPVVLPGQLAGDLPQHPSRYALTTDVAIDPAMRGHDVSLVLGRTFALATLVVDGERIVPLEASPFDRHRVSQMHTIFRIPARSTDRAVLPLRIEIEHRGWFSSGFGRAPFLGNSPFGGASLQRALSFNRAATFGATAILAAVFVPYALLFALDRRRRADGWLALLAASMVGWHLAILGVTQLIGPLDVQLVPLVTSTLACVATLGFIREHLGLGARGRHVAWLFVLTGALCIVLGPTPFRFLGLPQTLFDLLVLGTLAYQLVLLALEIRRGGERRLDAIAIFVAWCLVLVAVLGNKFAVDLQLVPVAWAFFVLTQAVLLARGHARELSARIVLLEERNRDVAVLNEELRRQIGDRAGALADALARLGSGGSTRSRFLPGEKIADRYTIVRTIGAGGMGAVHEVERINDHKRFALKVLAGRRTLPALSRFAREAQVLARFDHPNLVGIVDVDVDASGLLFVVMELVEGESLDGWIAPSPESLRDTLRQIAVGLEALHAHGIVHRDLKPANVLVANGVVKIADFGIARLRRDDVTGDDDTVSAEDATQLQDQSSLTKTGAIMGTPAYMAPELARGARDAEPSSDIFSFGVIAFELATGGYPFKQPAVLAAYASSRAERADPAKPLPSWCAALVERCLAEEPERRPSAAELVAELAARA